MTETAAAPTHESPAPPRRRLRIGSRVAAVLLAAFAAVLMMGLIDLGTLVGTSDPRYDWPVSLDVSWGGLFTFQLAASYVWLAVLPHRPLPAVVQLGVSAVALLAGAAIAGDPGPVWVALAVAATAVLFALPLRRQPVERPAPLPSDWPSALLATAGLVLWVPYLVAAADVARSPHAPYITNGIDHWPVQVAAGLAIPALVVALAVWPTIRPFVRGCVSLSAALVGIAQLAYPERGGALMTELWGIAVVVWAVLLALLPPAPTGRSGPRA